MAENKDEKKGWISRVLSKIFTPIERVMEPLERMWPNWLSARRWYIRVGIPVFVVFPIVIYAYMMNYKANVYPTLTGDAAAQACAVLPAYMQGGIGAAMQSTKWFPSFITSMDRTKSDWFYSFWGTMDWQLALAMGLAAAFTVYSLLKVFEIRARAKALGEGKGLAKDAGKAAAVGAGAAIWVTLATCWGPALLAIVFGMNVISFSGSAEGEESMFQFVIPKPYILLFILAIVGGGMWWMNHKEQACSLLEGEGETEKPK
ncbi:MAG: hypothetical protein A2Z09_04695 [Nitrospirae bacterium RBG_16_43_8]|nr:MAG: hypothetical protein A2Z09_04695 [Nitrospirae bacterium RBG_16_43_8]